MKWDWHLCNKTYDRGNSPGFRAVSPGGESTHLDMMSRQTRHFGSKLQVHHQHVKGEKHFQHVADEKSMHGGQACIVETGTNHVKKRVVERGARVVSAVGP